MRLIDGQTLYVRGGGKRARQCASRQGRWIRRKRSVERMGGAYEFWQVPDDERGYWISEHKAVAERILGRKLTRRDAVHHINGDALDNRHENLLICSNSYHKWLHGEYSRQFARTLGVAEET